MFIQPDFVVLVPPSSDTQCKVHTGWGTDTPRATASFCCGGLTTKPQSVLAPAGLRTGLSLCLHFLGALQGSGVRGMGQIRVMPCDMVLMNTSALCSGTALCSGCSPAWGFPVTALTQTNKQNEFAFDSISICVWGVKGFTQANTTSSIRAGSGTPACLPPAFPGISHLPAQHHREKKNPVQRINTPWLCLPQLYRSCSQRVKNK